MSSLGSASFRLYPGLKVSYLHAKGFHVKVPESQVVVVVVLLLLLLLGSCVPTLYHSRSMDV